MESGRFKALKLIADCKKNKNQILDLGCLKLTELPVEILELTELRILNLGIAYYNPAKQNWVYAQGARFRGQDDNQKNQISNINILKGLEKLTGLYLWGNNIEDLTFLKDLPQLERLDFRWNQVKDLSFLKHLDLLISVNFFKNPIISPPPEIIQQGLDGIRNYFQEIDFEGSDFLFEAKMLVVGSGGVGKTSLCKKVLDSDYELLPETDDETTEGIDIMTYEFEIAGGKSFRVNMWDFGGQEIYHSTHQFFLTKRSLYVLVTDTRKEDDDLPYWLNIQQLLAGYSPMFIVQNEKKDRVKSLKENEIRGTFPNVQGFLQTNLKTNRGLKPIKKNIEAELQKLPHIGDELPKIWIRIREVLEARIEDYISEREYFEICENEGMEDTLTMQKDERALWLSEYLHDLGVILHFKDHPLLKRMVILNNEWATDAVYKVLDDKNVKNNWGKFKFSDLEKIWDEPQYEQKHLELITLMKKFKLCFEIEGKSEFIAPQRLKADKPEYEWKEENNLQLKYVYGFMPKGILARLIVEMHSLIKDNLIWNTGGVFSNNKTIAEVK